MRLTVLTAAALSLVLLLPSATAADRPKAGDSLQITFDSDDPNVELSDRYEASRARLAVTTRNGEAMLLLSDTHVAVQLSDAALGRLNTSRKESFLEAVIVSSVKGVLESAVEYPIAHIRSAEIRNGALVLTSDAGKPVFDNVRVEGKNVTHDLATADAARFVREFRRLKAR
jgi:hypothetical protein